jgi:hypothetical protein
MCQIGFTPLPSTLLREQPAVVHLLEGLSFSTLKQDGHGGLCGSGSHCVVPYIHRESCCIVVCCSSIGRSLGGSRAEDLRASTINIKISMVRPLGGAGAEDPGVPAINIRKRRWRAPWEALELEIRQCPPSTLENVDGGAPRRCRS